MKESRENFEFWVGFCFVLYMYKKREDIEIETIVGDVWVVICGLVDGSSP